MIGYEPKRFRVCLTPLVITFYMDSELQEIIQRLDKLVLQRSQITNELSSVDAEIASTIVKRNNKQRELSAKTKEKGLAKDSKGELIAVGDHIETVTRGKYFERKGEVISIDHKNKTITLRYLISKKETWRKAYNVVKVSK